MKNFKHILVPTDFGPASHEAVELAVSMARTFNAKLTLLHVWEIPIYPYMDFMLNSEVISKVEDAATSRLAHALVEVQKEVPTAQSILKHGLPWGTIVDVIKQIEPDLVVMGTHGHRGVNHVILGSVAERLVRLSPVAVLTVRAPNAS